MSETVSLTVTTYNTVYVTVTATDKDGVAITTIATWDILVKDEDGEDQGVFDETDVTNNADGTYDFDFPIDIADPDGVWTLDIRCTHNAKNGRTVEKIKVTGSVAA